MAVDFCREREYYAGNMSLLESGAGKGIYFCTDEKYCSGAYITLKQLIDSEVDQTYNCDMDSLEKQKIYIEMLASGEAVLEENASGEIHAVLTEKGWKRSSVKKPAV